MEPLGVYPHILLTASLLPPLTPSPLALHICSISVSVLLNFSLQCLDRSFPDGYHISCPPFWFLTTHPAPILEGL